MRKISLKIETYWRLGLLNLWRVFYYRLGVRLGFNPVRKLQATAPRGPFFYYDDKAANLSVSGELPRIEAFYLFGCKAFPLTRQQPPDWFKSPFYKRTVNSGDKAWWQISDFDLDVGDIKQIWELSRFDWLIKLAQKASFDDRKSLNQLEVWLQDWIDRNPPYQGVNWKCGQEVSIRVLHLIVAAKILGCLRRPEKALVELIHIHLQRIAPTISYAIAQDNNHGTSEAAAMYVGGLFLLENNFSEGQKYASDGRRWLEDRAHRLIGTNGTFSQYSVNYHRLMLDTLCLSELARDWFGDSDFSTCFYKKAQLATYWLTSLVEPDSGDVPNLGANDGARLIPVTEGDYRDYRPAVILASRVFLNAFPEKLDTDSVNCDVLAWFGLEKPNNRFNLSANQVFDDGGFAVLTRNNSKVVVRYPKFKFRPGQNDLLHVDFWLGKENLLRDAGSYSYNCEEPWQSYFPSVEAHNTVQFDDREQMPRVGRFLLGGWPKPKDCQLDESQTNRASFSCSYINFWGNTHKREVILRETGLKVIDFVAGFNKKAVVRYRLSPQRMWRLDKRCVTDGEHLIKIKAGVPIDDIRLVTGWESRYYFKKTELQVLEIELSQQGRLSMEYHW